ncbi:MAG: glycine cleavage system protein H [Candidatus Marinimicrobia bacterium]|jgi:glycine cleavage system H protein|nr:glycine cleavage system protein H [Candidatus Neomarinimicrobiota bacterium]HJL82239.1 glycine cleavage system protein H [Gammaproteobacteria bacterium]MBT3946842.1 glycine cleavage system protein H [Candidatus Neomarinimicrobiota bacterium]MBT4063884.1 glycine cleavage system protein H [Candidatus Neomarinimicrobiota bacterium]MBT5777036.1 glycine cleavage system protein H [Candidatus Neomarinimicrobiota bacterium]|tara:strand:+ start:154 stop:588 length:435 start_codon:yes stop_codon:yes gene_type:complete
MKKQFDFKSDRFYNSNHFWSKQDDAGIVTVGMDELGLDSLGEMAYLTLPAVGTPVEMGKVMGSMEAAKMTGELFAPISGIVVEKNDAVLQNPLLVNEDPFDKGWLIKIEPANWEEESGAMVSNDELSAWMESEIERFETQGMAG